MQEKILKDNMVIGYYGDMAIVENEYEERFFFKCPEGVIPVGSICDTELQSIKILSKKNQEEIFRRFPD